MTAERSDALRPPGHRAVANRRSETMNNRLINACRCEPTDVTPVWLMRQAGRYLPEYRALRESHPILTLIKTPELATEVTLQPLRRFDLDAAIVFADILPPLEAMGLELEFVKGDGPIFHNPVRSTADVKALRVPSAEESLNFTLETIRLVTAELDGRLPLIGFAGAPFTLACYAVEGGSSRHSQRVKSLAHSEPQLWHALMEKLTDTVVDYLDAQAVAGVQVLQLFDSWAGVLSPDDFREFVLPHSQRLIGEVKRLHPDIPLIHFATGNSAWLALFREAGGDVIGVDWRIDFADARAQLGDHTPVQGNLDPLMLFAPEPALQDAAARILKQNAGRPGHIFNLGHGVLPETPIEQVAALVDAVHNYHG